MPKYTKTERAEAVARLREWIKPGDTIYCILRHVSKSGMSRVIDLKTVGCEDGKPSMGHIGYNVALALDMPYDRKREGVKIGGCGMDMGFAIVHDLASGLFPSYPCQGERCPSSEHQRTQTHNECDVCNGRGFVAIPDDEGNPETKCAKCRGYGRFTTYGDEPPRGVGVMHKDSGYSLSHTWI